MHLAGLLGCWAAMLSIDRAQLQQAAGRSEWRPTKSVMATQFVSASFLPGGVMALGAAKEEGGMPVSRRCIRFRAAPAAVPLRVDNVR